MAYINWSLVKPEKATPVTGTTLRTTGPVPTDSRQGTRLPKCVMFGELVEAAGCGGVEENEWMRCLLDGLRAFGINADQRTTAAQDEGKWRRTAGKGAERFMAKWIATQKASARLRHAVVVKCPNVMGRTRERIAQSKRARAGSLAIVD